MEEIKRRRRTMPLDSRPGLHVGECVPFYFCPRSVMLYMLHKGNHPQLAYQGGQGPIVHLEADLRNVVAWAESAGAPLGIHVDECGFGVLRGSV